MMKKKEIWSKKGSLHSWKLDVPLPCCQLLHLESALDREHVSSVHGAFVCPIFGGQNSEISYEKQTGLMSCTLPRVTIQSVCLDFPGFER
jgi:hypothetical protein